MSGGILFPQTRNCLHHLLQSFLVHAFGESHPLIAAISEALAWPFCHAGHVPLMFLRIKV